MIFCTPSACNTDPSDWPYDAPTLIEGHITLLQTPIDDAELAACQPKAPLGFLPPLPPTICPRACCARRTPATEGHPA